LESEDQAKLATCDGSIDWKGHYDSLKRQADAKVAELEAKLSDMTDSRDAWLKENIKWEEACRARARDIDKLLAQVAELEEHKNHMLVSKGFIVAGPSDDLSEVAALINKKAELQGALHSAQQNLARIEKATMRLRGFREINSHDPARCIEDAATMLQKLTFKNHKLQDDWNKDHMEMKRKFDEAESYIEKLEQDLSIYRGVAGAIKGYEETLQ
jgi:hypothetical protein